VVANTSPIETRRSATYAARSSLESTTWPVADIPDVNLIIRAVTKRRGRPVRSVVDLAELASKWLAY
jgi:hypothetical protein